MIISEKDLNYTQIARLGRMLMHHCDNLSDALWEDFGCDPEAILSHPTICMKIGIDFDECINTFDVRIFDRTSPIAGLNLVALGHDEKSWWIPIDEYVGSNGQCTLAEVVDFLGSETYDFILKNPIMLRAMAADMLRRYSESEDAA
ncbi:hypothetical protein [Rhizobium leguminosarum]|uniref:hypothetical protein n=1 Tax=Rhizobium leguminosarum TaxID=384 RepID=UPI001C94BAE9|nr:hypothetical protein [Rhizobium leguminosarum]MBY5462057.1 hypothetical protein [Rhizobium leguminosarum]